MSTVTVRLYFNDGTSTYTFPHVQSVSDPKEGIKAVVIDGTRADGSIVIPGGKKSQEIVVKGIIFEDNYLAIMTEKASMESGVTTNPATLKLQYWNGAWQDSWSLTVRRITEIEFDDSLRFNEQPYSASFLVLNY